jgi:hypothetical protein
MHKPQLLSALTGTRQQIEADVENFFQQQEVDEETQSRKKSQNNLRTWNVRLAIWVALTRQRRVREVWSSRQ